MILFKGFRSCLSSGYTTGTFEYRITSGHEYTIKHDSIIVHSGRDMIERTILSEIKVTRHHIVKFAKLGFAEIVFSYNNFCLSRM